MTRFIRNKGKDTIRMITSSNNVFDYFEKNDFVFSREVITRYFLSLKTKPFVILTGISGSGKTKIAQVFAEYMCQDAQDQEKARRIAFIPVRPDWMDNRGLLGFYNLLDEKYYATPLLRLLLDAWDNPSLSYFVILDEMNLAKVEYYFSDFLSIMESRTVGQPRGEPLRLHSLEKVSTHYGLKIPEQIYIPPNVFFTGTVNVDESTYMFSPKVLDRSNVIEFNEVNLSEYQKGLSTDSNFILIEPDVRNQLLNRDGIWFASRADYLAFWKNVETDRHPLALLLDLLKKFNLHYGYRVINEMSRFINLSNGRVKSNNNHEVIDIQILQKVLPKFHGTQARLQEPLEAIQAFCLDPEAALKGETGLPESSKNSKALFPRTLKKVKLMLSVLIRQGYTSFIE